jgi:hypothetical protein
MATRRNSFKQASEAFRANLFDLSAPRFTTAAKQDVYEYADFFRDNHAPPWLFELTQAWAKLYDEPYKGVTSDGTVKQDLFKAQDEGIEIEEVVKAADEMLQKLDGEQEKKVRYSVGAKEWRAWSNPEILLRPFGLRLEEGKQVPLSLCPCTDKITYSSRTHRRSHTPRCAVLSRA